MKIITSSLFVLAIVYCGFAADDFKAGSGDVGQFIVQELKEMGVMRLNAWDSAPLRTKGLPSVTGQWSHWDTKSNVTIHMGPEQYDSVVVFLHQLVTAHPVAEGASEDGNWRAGVYLYLPTFKGWVAMFYSYDTNRTEIIIVWPQRW